MRALRTRDRLARVTGIRISAVLLFTVFSLALQSGVAQSGPPSIAIYMDSSRPINIRVDNLVSRMTLEEKASQLVNQSRAIPRLQVPEYGWWSEALHGVAFAGTATVDAYSMKNRTYRYFDGRPLYPFGYGLSYSEFEYSNLKLSTSTLNAGDPLSIEADVKNLSDHEGDEVAQVYLSYPKSRTNPIHALRGVTRLHLAGGETQHVHFALDARDLSSVASNGDRAVSAGQYRISVGGGQPGTAVPQVEAEFGVTGE